MIRNCICGLKRDPKDPSFAVVSGLEADPAKGTANVSTITMFACRGCGVVYVNLKPENKVVLAG